jgi:hypothetical protein
MTTLTREKQFTVQQIASILKIESSAFMLIDEMKAVLSTQYEINEFMVRAIGYDCKEPTERREVGMILRKLRMKKMKEYRLSLTEFVKLFEVDPVGALSHLLVEKIKPIHIIRIKEYSVSPNQIYETHLKYPTEFLFGLLHRM